MTQKQLQQFYTYVCKLFVLKAEHPQQQALEIEDLVSNMLKASCTMDNIKATLNQQTEFDVLEQIRQLKLYKDTSSKLRQQGDDQEQARITRLTQENGQLNKIIKDLRASTDQCFSELAQAKQSAADLKDELGKAKKAANDNADVKLENERLRQTTEQLNGRINQLSSELQQSKQNQVLDAQKTQNVQAQLRSANESAQETLRLYQDAQKENQRFEHIIDNMRKEFDEQRVKHSAELQQALERGRADDKAGQEAQEVVAELESRVQQVQSLLVQKQTELDDSIALTMQLQADIQNIQADLVKAEEQNERMASENRELRQNIENIASEVQKRLESALSDCKQRADEQQQLLSTKDAQIQQLGAEIDALRRSDAESKDGRPQDEQLTLKYEAKCKEVEEANEDLEVLMEQCKRDQEAHIQVKQALSQKEKEILELKDVVGVLEEQLAEYKEMINQRF